MIEDLAAKWLLELTIERFARIVLEKGDDPMATLAEMQKEFARAQANILALQKARADAVANQGLTPSEEAQVLDWMKNLADTADPAKPNPPTIPMP